MTRSNTIAQTFKAALVGASALLGLASAAQAQDTPQAVQAPRDSAPPQTDMWAACTPNAVNGGMTPNCWVIQYKGATTWAYSFKDNRMAFGIVTYDASGKVLRNVTMAGARYVYKITVDPAAQTVTVWGQSDNKAVIRWADLPGFTPTPPAPTGPVYTWTSAGAPPANVVTSHTAPQVPICRGTDASNRLWAGWWDGSACNGVLFGMPMLANQNVQFLTTVSGSPNWVAGQQGNLFDPIPANTINAGRAFSQSPGNTGWDQLICSYMGRAGWIYSGRCDISGTVQGVNIPYALTGTLQ